MATAKIGLLFVMLIFHTVDSSCDHCRPHDTAAVVNESVSFNCSTLLVSKEVYWYFYHVGAAPLDRKLVYGNGKFYDNYVDECEIDKDPSKGKYNLRIHSVKLQHAGKYECQDDYGQGDKLSAQLIVLDSKPVCTSNIDKQGSIGANSCGIEPDKLNLSCSTTYSGNIPPVAKWSKFGENGSLGVNDTKGEPSNMITINASVPVENSMNGSHFVCEILPNTGSQISCSTDTVRLLYAFNSTSVEDKVIKEEVKCTPNTSSQVCSYKWKLHNGKDTDVISTNQLLSLDRVGLHWCEATCSIRDHQCVIRAQAINASAGANSYTVIVAVLVVVVIGATVIAVIVFCLRRRRRRSRNNKETKVDEHFAGGENAENAIVIDGDNESLLKTPAETEVVTGKRKRDSGSSQEENITSDDVSPQLLHVLRAHDPERTDFAVSGLTMMAKELFVAFEGQPELEVFQSITFQFLRSFFVDGLETATDIVSNCYENHLYILSPGRLSIADRIGGSVADWVVDDDAISLSVTPQSNILITCWHGLLREYKEDLEIHKVQLPPGVRPFHALKVTSGNFLVSNEYNQIHSVGIFDTNGTLLRSFVGLKFPKYLAIDQSSKGIFVADQKNSRVLWLSHDLGTSKEFLTAEHGIERPTKIFVDENNQLFVADSGNRNYRIAVFGSICT